MTIRYAILGLLSWHPCTGYDLKKMFADSSTLYWSGNNNQIYTTLIQMHNEGLVTVEVHPQESLPARKIYTISPEGRAALRDWVLSAPEPFELRSTFLIQLGWADQLSPQELDTLLTAYQTEIEEQLITQREKARRAQSPNRTPREKFLWEMVAKNLLDRYENELAWLRAIREGLKRY
ncbi:MAG: PadR family transcriptional regulator [Anaerolineaceae bacterium]|nr:PadR family transcriptional regulator [Anaerolineaceae bacterium]